MRFPLVVCVFVCIVAMTLSSFGQSPNGNINGLISDPTNAAVADAEIVAVNDVTGVQYTTKTNNEGIYVLPNLPPGPYRVQVSKIGFKTLIKPDITLNVQDSLSINFTLLVGAFHEIVTVQGGAPLVNTESATVSTVVDRQFAENLPMNGRSFQTLIYLAPGVAITPSNPYDGGQFSVNGQRAESNYWMVDGVSANVGVGAGFNPGNGLGGALGSFSVLGGTNSLVSVDAMQEFRIQTSTYAPEFGRTPGAQVSIVTRSGTNQLHGSFFDYFRNDILDANDWFADYAGLPKPEERQNDFGGTIGGPVRKNRTFFFFSYEGLRLRLPQVTLDTVPDLAARESAIPAMQPYLQAYPLPTPGGTDNLSTGTAQFNASYSNAATLNAYSLRIDHKLNSSWNFFGRYNYSPSEITNRGSGSLALSVVQPDRITAQTATAGLVWTITNTMMNDLRFNFSRTNSSSYSYQDSFGGALPLVSLPLPNPFTSQDSSFQFLILSLKGPELHVGTVQHVLQRQYNLVDGLVIQEGQHTLKLGADYRRLSPVYAPPLYAQDPIFLDVPSSSTGTPLETVVGSAAGSTLLFHNLSAYAQDTWHVHPRLTLTYGLRWDVDFAPSTAGGPNIPGVTGFDVTDLSNLALAPAGTPPFRTTYGDVAPRFGLIYQVFPARDWQTVARGGIGVFYDLASSQIGSALVNAGYPFSASNYEFGNYPLPPPDAAPPAITAGSLSNCCGALVAFDPHLRLPYTLQWNVAVEQGLGQQQVVTASYIGSAGRRLLQTGFVLAPNPNLYAAMLVGNTAQSDYNALQLQFQRRLLGGFQMVASYTWSHSIDDASAGSTEVSGNAFAPNLGANVNRGPSDFDVRNAFSAGVTYEIPAPQISALTNAVLHHWAVETFIMARSAPPVDVTDQLFYEFDNGFNADTRPDLVPGEPLYLYGSACLQSPPLGFGQACPGGKGFNPNAFTNPPVDPSTGNPLRQGTASRNLLRGFGAAQWDLAVHRDFPVRESFKVQFRAEMFNIVNHPNFGPPDGGFGTGGFGLSSAMLGQSLSGSNVGGGALSPLYQIGGPRSIQLALKVMF